RRFAAHSRDQAPPQLPPCSHVAPHRVPATRTQHSTPLRGIAMARRHPASSALITAPLDLSPSTVEPWAWDELAGLAQLKQLIERRVLLPLHERERAAKHGLQPPGALLLFGPPGTGKTMLARAIAGRLGWAFVE